VVERIKGLRQLGENLRALGDEVGSKIARSATGRAARIVKDEEVREAPIAKEDYVIEGQKVQKGNIPKQIVVKRVKSSDTKLTSEHVVAIRGKKRHGFASRVASLYEFGTVKQPARSFVRKSWDAKKEEAKNELIGTLARGIDRAVKKAKK
jgi:HK97 gp10 family phage protein